MHRSSTHRSSTLLRVALLGSALALAATSATAGQWNADQKRLLAATGMRSSAPHGTQASTGRHVPGWTYTVLHNFAGSPNDGGGPFAEVTFDSAGNIYGTTEDGGSNGLQVGGYGTIFKVATDGTESLLHSFAGAGDGRAPGGAAILEPNGDMIGTTTGAYSASCNIWKLAADGTYTVLHIFVLSEGDYVRGKLIQDKKGNFYGTSVTGGGASDSGTVFKFNAKGKGKLTVLHTFDGTDGDAPQQGVISDKAGNLYGVTSYGGVYDEGTVYKIAKDGTFSTLYNFTGGSDGGFLYGSLAIDKDGNLYGSTAYGGTTGAGTVFKLAPDGTLTTLYNFTGGADGANPNGDMLLMGDKLYSTTTGGGDSGCHCGTVYEVTTKGKEKTIQIFTSATGGLYAAGLTPYNGALYGTTSNFGSAGYGTLFSLTKK